MRKLLLKPIALAAALSALAQPAVAQTVTETVSLKQLSRISTGVFDDGASEIPTYDPVSQRLFVVNASTSSIDVVDLADPSAPVKLGSIDVSPFGAQANSVAANNGLLAAAIEADEKQENGVMVLFDTTTLQPVSQVGVGALPDMLCFSADGRRVLVANEGEPNDDYDVDPEGSVSIIDISNPATPVVRNVSFAGFNDQRDALLAAGVRLFGPGASVAQDLEPEYIALASNGKTAYVTLQENNAMAIIDVTSASVTQIAPLGYKDHAAVGNGLDASDEDGGVNIRNWPVLGMYQPDTIALFKGDGNGPYLIMANEGDARDYDGFAEEERIEDLDLDPTAFPDADALQAEAALGRLNVTTTLGDADNDGDYDALYAFGARSLSIRSVDGGLIWDSGDDLEQLTAMTIAGNFNANNDDNEADGRSDNKGPEPEGLAVGRVKGRDYVFAGLERASGIVVYDISTPAAPRLVQYVNPRNFAAEPEDELAQAGDLGPEGLLFVAEEDSPIDSPLLIVGNEISGTTTVYKVQRVKN